MHCDPAACHNLILGPPGGLSRKTSDLALICEANFLVLSRKTSDLVLTIGGKPHVFGAGMMTLPDELSLANYHAYEML